MGNLSFEVTRDELIQAFSAAGKVSDAKVPTDRETGRPRGFAFVEFEDEAGAQKSIALLNGKPLRGRPLRVNEAENRPPRPPGAGGGPPYRPSSFRGGEPPPPPAAEFSEFDRKGESRNRRSRSPKNQGPRKSEQPPRRTERRRNRGIDDEDY